MKTIYTKGTIITLDHQDINALVEENGIIIETGDYEDLYEEGMKVVDLKGNILMPSFIDAHSHISGYAMGFLQVSLNDCQRIEDIQKQIKKYINDNHIQDNQFVTCKGYNQENLKEKRHITKQELNKVSSAIPIVIQHYTGHCGIMNNAALEYLNINEETRIDGGKINVEEGFLEENAYTSYVQKIPMPSIKSLKDAYDKAQSVYASYGITTIQDGMIVDELKDIYKELLKDDVFFLDIVGYPGFQANQFVEEFKDYKKNYKHHFKIGGYKMFLDGSPQNKTAWTIDPYVDGTYGYPTLTDDQIKENFIQAINENVQVLAHCNGDQAIEHYIEQYSLVHKQDIRPVIIHAQMMRSTQMPRVKALNMIPSFFIGHVYYFGEIHKRNMGEKRASTISPLASALKNNIPFTMHTDAPVIEPNMLESIHIAVNRKTIEKHILGPQECIEPLDALKAITTHAAYQYFEEDTKGTLSVKKKADMVILSDNPLTIDKDHIKDIEILTTIKDGMIVFER